MTTRRTRTKQSSKKNKASVKKSEKASTVHIGKESPGRHRENELTAGIDRLGSLVGKSIELAETGLTLAVRMMQRAGGAGQESIINRLFGTVPGGRADADASQAQYRADESRAYEQASGGDAQTADAGPVIENRMLVYPGAAIRVTFSVSNDSPSAQQDMKVKIGQLSGMHTGAVLPEGILTVSPSQVVIEPMDFEKCVVSGTLPPDTVSDLYTGAVTLEGSQAYSILFRLYVNPAQTNQA